MGSRFLGIFFSMPVLAIGMYGTHTGWHLSKKLNKVRSALMDAHLHHVAMTFDEFNSVCEYNGVRFDSNELEYVTNALIQKSEKSSGENIISINEFHDWLKEGLMIIV